MTRIRSSDSSNIQDRRGRGGGGGMSFPGLGGGGRLPIPGGMAGGGGLVGVLIVAAIIILPRLLGGGGGTSLLAPEAEQVETGSGAACDSEQEQIVCGAVVDIQEFWGRAYPQAFGRQYQETDLVFFSGGTSTGCGEATSQTGPFYCPADGFLYVDLDFMDQLQSDFGAPGDLATQYIVAHEFGHHVQNLTGQNARVQQASGNAQQALSIALELQADCYAGTWVYDAERRRSEEGERLIDDGEITEALGAAAAVGDDRIQMRTQGRVNPETFSHGTSEQRESWFRRGYETGDPLQCDTFAEL